MARTDNAFEFMFKADEVERVKDAHTAVYRGDLMLDSKIYQGRWKYE